MFSLDQILGQQQGNSALGQISQVLGADQGQTNSAIGMALPMILGAMNQQAQQQPDAFSTIVNMATENDGTILDDVAGYLTGSQSTGNMAGNILGGIFGNKQAQVTEQISQGSGLGLGQVAQLLMMLAPLIMGFLGRQQTQQNLDQDGLGSMIGGYTQQAEQTTGNPMSNVLGNLLDSDGDGSSMDDIASMAMKYMTNR